MRRGTWWRRWASIAPGARLLLAILLILLGDGAPPSSLAAPVLLCSWGALQIYRGREDAGGGYPSAGRRSGLC